MADLLPESFIYPLAYAHRLSILFLVLQFLPAHHAAYAHNGAGERAAGLALPSHASSEGAPGLKNILTSYIQFFLQSCKNGLRSPEIIHVILKG